MFVIYYLCINVLRRMLADFYVLAREMFLMDTCLGFIHFNVSINLSIYLANVASQMFKEVGSLDLTWRPVLR